MDLMPVVVALTLFSSGSFGAGVIAPDHPVSPQVEQANTAPIVAEGVVAAPAREVWRIFSTGEGFTKLGPAKADVDLRVGGLIRAHYRPDGVLGDEGTIQNRILAFEPGRMIAFQIDSPPKSFPFTDAYRDMWTVVTLSDLGDARTHVRIVGLGFTGEEQSQRMREFFRSGNEWTIKTLQSTFDTAVQPGDITTAHSPSPTAPIDISRVVPVSRAALYRAFTTGEGWKQAMGVESRIEARPGGPFEIFFMPAGSAPDGERGSEGCTVLSIVPDEMFSFTWNAPPKLEFARTRQTWCVVNLDDVDDARATRVRLRHLGFDMLAQQHPEHADEFAQCRAYFASAWPKVLEAFADRFGAELHK